MKICVVTSSFPRFPGDYAGLNVYHKAMALSAEHEVHVIYPSNTPAPYPEGEPFIRHSIRYPFRTYPLAQVRGTDMLNVVRLLGNMAGAIRQIKREQRINLFYAFWTIPSAFVCALACGSTPYMVDVLGSDARVFGRNGIAAPLIGFSLKRATHIVALTGMLKDEAVALGARGDKITVIPPGIDLSIFRPMDKVAARAKLGLPAGALWIYVGSLFRIKRVDRVIKAAAELRRQFDFHVLIVGDGPERPALQDMARSLGVSNITFAGRVPHDDMPHYMAAADVLLLLSETEGLPECVQEAMAACVPVVATRVGGLPEIIRNGVNGYLVESDREVAERLNRLMTSPGLGATLGFNARRFAEEQLSNRIVFDQVNSLCKAVGTRGQLPVKKVSSGARGG